MEIETIINNSLDEVLDIMKTESFKSSIHKDATIAFIAEYSRVLLVNYHQALSARLKSKGIEI